MGVGSDQRAIAVPRTRGRRGGQAAGGGAVGVGSGLTVVGTYPSAGSC